MLSKPHKIAVEDLADSVKDVQFAFAGTVDLTQYKKLTFSLVLQEGKVGVQFKVSRRYNTSGSAWESVHQGDDASEAVRIYNGMS